MIKRNQLRKTRSSKDTKRSKALSKRRRLNVEGLEERRLLAVLTDLPTAPALELTEYTTNRNVGAVQSFTFNESESFVESGANDVINDADLVPIGTGFGQQDTVDIFGTLPVDPSSFGGFAADLDTFGMTLRGGDILDIAVLGAATQFIIRDDSGQTIFGSTANLTVAQPPRQSLGNATGTYVAPRDGNYYLTVAPDIVGPLNSYTIGLRAYRPVTEELEVGDAQIIYLDFDGDVIDGNLVQSTGFVRIPSLVESLPLLGIEAGNINAANNIMEKVITGTVRIFEDLVQTGENGDYTDSSVPGEYAVRILNSRDHGGQIPLNDPRLTRMMIGGSGDDIGVPGVYGYSYGDLGNFDLTGYGFFALDTFGADAQAAVDGGISPNKSQVDFIGDFLAAVVAHEASHALGMDHTNGDNFTGTLSDEGTANSASYGQGLGPDGIYGTSDDVAPVFADDFYSAEEEYLGINEITNTLAHVLSSGTKGGGNVSGRVFFDENLNGSSVGDGGLAGATVFADVNGDGVHSAGEPIVTTGIDGAFSMSLRAGVVQLYASAPATYLGTTPSVVTVNVPNAGTVSGVEFGFGIVSGVKTGVAFDDADGDGIMDANEAPLEGVYIYLDTDGDDRPDLGEANVLTGADGGYFYNFGDAGNYTIRAVAPVGYQVSSPTSGEHNIFFDGVAASNEYNFGFRSTLDFGDAPNSYGTSLPDGARHGIVGGLSIGPAPDRDGDGNPSIDADGDDLNQFVNDEEGVLQTTPLAPGASADFLVTMTNTTGSSAYLQGFLDFNQDGDFDDAGEKFLSDRRINSGVTNVTYSIAVNVPSDAPTGDTYLRFRLSQTGGLGASGFAGTGEVQDHKVTILNGSEIANDDYFEVARNAVAERLDVLENDFQLASNPLQLDSLNLTNQNGDGRDTFGTVTLSPLTNQITYTPLPGFLGSDAFSYTVRDQFGSTSTARVVVNVKYQSNVPIALDDNFFIPTNSQDRPLAVLDNDIGSVNGGLVISSVSAGTNGGALAIVSGGQSIRYTPVAGFGGSEQFSYTVKDGAGLVDVATVTVNMSGSNVDDLVAFDIEILNFEDEPINSIAEGNEFKVRVTVDDLTDDFPDGVATAFMDLLYTADLVSVVDYSSNDFEDGVTWGSPVFNDSENAGLYFRSGDAEVPGLLNEIGSTQDLSQVTQQTHSGPTTLFEVTMRANASGIAQFTGDPANTLPAETALIGSNTALSFEQLGFNSTSLIIGSSSENVTAAVDDSYPDGIDSDGNIIQSGGDRHFLDVLDNDIFGVPTPITEFEVSAAAKGNVFVDRNGTINDFSDDFLSYQPNSNESGLEEFSYYIVTGDGAISFGNVTLALGEQNADASVEYIFSLVDRGGNSLLPSEVTVGDEIGLQIHVNDMREGTFLDPSTFVYAGYLDVLYDAENLEGVGEPSEVEIDFGPDFSPLGLGASGSTNTPGIVNEVGSFRTQALFNAPYSDYDNAELVTIFFKATAPGVIQFKGSPAELSPNHDTLLYQVNVPILNEDIKHDVLTVTISAAGSQQQNQNSNEDVNNDGIVSPIDALLVINDLVINGEGESSSDGSSKIYPDVNGDYSVTARDVLLVLQFLTRGLVSGEGEQVSVESQVTKSTADEVFSDIGASLVTSTDKVVVNDCPKAPEVVDSTELNSVSHSPDEDEENGLLDLLADDVERIWN